MPEYNDQQPGTANAIQVLPLPAEKHGPPFEEKEPLLNRNLVLLTSGQAISNIGSYMYSATLPVWVLTLTSSVAAVSGISVAQYLPAFLIGPLAGIFIDRWNRRHTMIIANIAQAFCTLLPVLAVGTLRLPAIYMSIFLVYLFTCFFAPTIPAVLQVIVNKQRLAQATSISQAASSLAMILGSALATPLYFLVGPVPALLVNAASFLVSALCLWFIRAPKEVLHPYAFQDTSHVAQSISGKARSLGEDLVAGCRYILTDPLLQKLALVPLITSLGFGMLQAIEVIFLRDRLHASTALAGPLSASIAGGMLLGTIGTGILAKWIPQKPFLAASVCLLGISTIIYALQTVFLSALIMYSIMGILLGGVLVTYLSLFMNITPGHFMGRIMSVIQMGTSAMLIISAATAGYLGQYLPVHLIFVASGLLIVLAGLVIWLSLRNHSKEAIRSV